jgi:hypothetical protein
VTEEEKKKQDSSITVYDQDAKDYKTFPKKPGVIDYVKEGFENQTTRANIDAIRRRIGAS